jgi:hypothetical protein
MRLLLTSILVLAAGCVGNVGSENMGDDGTTNDTRPAKTVFKADVFPALGKCSGGACHDIGGTSSALSKFYNVDADMTYTATVMTPTLVDNFSSLAPILQHIQGGHKGLMYSPDEATKITNWLAKETSERAGGGGGGGGGSNQPPAFDSKKALETWSGCLSVANFKTANMTNAFNTLAADNLQKCVNCHQGAISGFYIGTAEQTYFDQVTQHTAYLLKYFTVDSAAQKVIVNLASFKSATMISGHPTFNPTTNIGVTALNKLYELTTARQTANQCDPSRLKD